MPSKTEEDEAHHSNRKALRKDQILRGPSFLSSLGYLVALTVTLVAGARCGAPESWHFRGIVRGDWMARWRLCPGENHDSVDWGEHVAIGYKGQVWRRGFVRSAARTMSSVERAHED